MKISPKRHHFAAGHCTILHEIPRRYESDSEKGLMAGIPFVCIVLFCDFFLPLCFQFSKQQFNLCFARINSLFSFLGLFSTQSIANKTANWRCFCFCRGNQSKKPLWMPAIKDKFGNLRGKFDIRIKGSV